MHVRKKHKFSNFGKKEFPSVMVNSCVNNFKEAKASDSSSVSESNLEVKKVSFPVVFTSCGYKRLLHKKPLLYHRHIAQKHNESAPFHCPKCLRAYVCKSVFLCHLQKSHKLQLNDQKVRKCQRVISNNSTEKENSASVQLFKATPKRADSKSKDYFHRKVGYF